MWLLNGGADDYPRAWRKGLPFCWSFVMLPPLHHAHCVVCSFRARFPFAQTELVWRERIGLFRAHFIRLLLWLHSMYGAVMGSVRFDQ